HAPAQRLVRPTETIARETSKEAEGSRQPLNDSFSNPHHTPLHHLTHRCAGTGRCAGISANTSPTARPGHLSAQRRSAARQQQTHSQAHTRKNHRLHHGRRVHRHHIHRL